MEEAPVKLDDLNPKQRLKEFKSTQKEIKSKEQATKQKALDKCKDIRYLVEGGCLFPMINSLSTKKNAFELSKITSEALLGFLQSAVKDNKQSIVSAFQCILTAEGNLEVLKILADIIIFKEEVKKKKPVKLKKGEVPPEEPPVIENPLVVDLRLTILKCVYYIVSTLYWDFSDENSALRTAFATVTNLTSNLAQIVCSCNEKLQALPGDTDVPARVGVTQLCEYAMMSLVFSLRYNRAAIPALLATPLMSSLQALAREAFFTVYSLQLLDIISTNAEVGVPALSGPESVGLYLTVLEECTKPLIEAAAAAAAAVPAKGKEVKKEAPKKGAPVVAEVIDPYEKVERVAVEANRRSVAVTKLVTNVLIAIAVKQVDLLEPAALEPILSLLSKLVLNSTLWQVTRDSLQSPLDFPLHDVIDSVCVLFGTLGNGALLTRKSVCQSGGLTALLSMMLQSKTIVNDPVDPAKPAPTEEALANSAKRLTNVRRAAGKAVLHLISDRATAETGTGGRWKSCNNFVTDAELFTTPPPTTTPPTPTVIAQLVEMIAVADDSDLVNRGVRLMSALLLGLGEGATDFIAATTFDALATAKLSVVVQSRAQSIIDQLAKEAADAKAAAEAALAAAQQAAEAEAAGIEVAVESPSEIATPAAPAVDLLIPNMFEAFYLSLTVLEKFFACLSAVSTPEAIKAFATRERLKVMSAVLNVLGPMAWNNTAEATVAEYSIPLRDPRVHSWYVSVNPHDTNAAASAVNVDEDSVFLRPLLFDVLAMIARSDAVYRTVEGELPPPPCVALPATKSITEEYALAVCRLCAEAGCSVLLCDIDYFAPSTFTIIPCQATQLQLSVLDAALGLLHAVTSCGVLGVTAAVEAIAESGFAYAATGNASTSVHNGSNINSSMSKLVLYLQNSNLVDGVTFPTLMPAGFAWKRPQFFDEVFPVEDVVPTSDLLKNQTLWPFVALCSSLQGIIANPRSTRPSAMLALRTVMGLTRVGTLSSHSQPVMCDVLSTVFISLGGLVHMAGFLGRFGNVNEEDKQTYNMAEFCQYLAGRGADRESFWRQYAEDNKPVEVLDPKTGKPIVKKDDKKKDDKKDNKKVDPKAAAAAPPIVTEIVYNIESTYEVPDPNRGPKSALWVKILEVVVPDEHVHCGSTTALLDSITGSLSELALQLISLGVNVNQAPEGDTSLMVGFLLNDAPVVDALIAAGANCNALDCWRNSVIKYCLMSMTAEDILKYLPGHRFDLGNIFDAQIVYGCPAQLDAFLHSRVDVNVLDGAGYSPIMLASGMGEMTVTIGGYRLCLRNVNSVFNENLDFFNTSKPLYAEIKLLYDAGSSVNLCDKQGITPLHIAAARGDLTLISHLFSYGAIANALDSFGFLHIHYAAACCPSQYFIETFNLLMSNSIERPVEKMVYADERTGRDQVEKDSNELMAYINSNFSEAFCPSIISKPRLHYHDLMLVLTSDRMNILQLAMAAHVIYAEYPHIRCFLTNNKMDRMSLSLHLLKCVKDSTGGMASLLSNVDNFGMTALHASSLLFQGTTPTRELTPAEIRSKRVKTYPSMELHLLDLIKIHTENRASDVCSNGYAVRGVYQWTPVHASIAYNNPNLFKTLMSTKDFDLSNSYSLVHLMASQGPKNQIHPDIVRVVVSAVAENSAVSHENLNGLSEYNCTPLHMAVRNGQAAVIEALASCLKVDLSLVDSNSQTTAFFEACQIGDIDVVRRFRRGADRMDFLGTLALGENCIEYVIRVGYTDILRELVSMRRNDVLECVITQKVKASAAAVDPEAEAPVVESCEMNSESILMRLESENLALAQQLGFGIPKEFLKVEVVEVKPTEEEGEETGEAAAAPAVEASNDVQTEDPYKIVVGITVRDSTGATEGDDVDPAEEEPLAEGAAAEATEVTAEPVLVEEAAPVSTLPPEVYEELLAKFNLSNELLRVLLDLVRGTSLVDASHHVHDMFAAGVLINEQSAV